MRPLILCIAALIALTQWPDDSRADSTKPAPAPALQPTPDQTQADRAYELAQAKQYHHCIIQAKTMPDDGLEEALAWSSLGGGEPARHCLALARIGQKQYEDGAQRLEDLARESHQDKAIRAEMLSQAAQAWGLVNNWDRARVDQETALSLMPDQTDILIDHAMTLGQLHNYKQAADELTRVIANHPGRIDALVLRASANRQMDKTADALNDVERALMLDPTDPDGLLERGMLRRMAGDTDGARADWLKIVNTIPTGDVVDTARRNLELLDVRDK